MKSLIDSKKTIVVTFLAIILAVAFLYLQGLNFGVDYHNSVNLAITFKSEIELEKIEDTLRQTKKFERLEKNSNTNYVATYMDLSKEDQEELNQDFTNFEQFEKLTRTDSRKINPSLQSSLVLIPALVIVLFASNYILLKEQEKSRDRVGRALSKLLQQGFIGLGVAVLLGVLSLAVSLSRDLVEFGLFLGCLGVVTCLYTILKKKSKTIHILSALITLPIIIVSSDPLYFVLLVFGFLLINLYAQNFAQAHFFTVWNFAIHNLPVIKDLKWVRK